MILRFVARHITNILLYANLRICAVTFSIFVSAQQHKGERFIASNADVRRIQSLWEEKGWTMAEAAEQLGIPERRYRTYKAGVHKFLLMVLSKLAVLYDTRVDSPVGFSTSGRLKPRRRLASPCRFCLRFRPLCMSCRTNCLCGGSKKHKAPGRQFTSPARGFSYSFI